jgi:hypothetical protein
LPFRLFVRILVSFIIACHGIAALGYGMSAAAGSWKEEQSIVLAAIPLGIGVGIALPLFLLAYLLRPR